MCSTPPNFNAEYGTSNLDVRHSAAAMVIFEAPWKLRGLGRPLRQWLDALGDRTVPQRTALHHAHIWIAA